MRIFVAGATGVIGRVLVGNLVEAGHAVTAMTRRPAQMEKLTSLGAEPVLCDVFEANALADAVMKARPEVLVHELTALPQAIDPRRIETDLAENDRIRTVGTRNLVRAASLAGVRRIIAQSVAFAYAPEGPSVKNEEAPLWLGAPWPWRRSVEAIVELEREVLSVQGVESVILRYGYLYGSGTAYAKDGAIASLVSKRQFPIGGKGSGIFSFVHVDDAASATAASLTTQNLGTYNIVDDEPAAVADWLPVYAEALRAPKPWRLPSGLVRMIAGRYGLYLMTEQRGASNRKAKGRLAWSPSWPTWRQGFRATIAERP